MHPPPSPTRTNHTNTQNPHSRVATTPSTPTTSSTTSNVNPAVSAALQGATLAFNKQKKAAATAAVGNNAGRGPSPSRPAPKQQNTGVGVGTSTSAILNLGPKTGTGSGTGSISQGTRLRPGNNGALLAATQAAREHAATAAAVSRAKSAKSAAAATEKHAGGVSRHGTGGGTPPASTSGGARDAAGSSTTTSGLGLEGGHHAHGGLVAQRLMELHTGGGASGTLLPPPAGRSSVDGGKQAPSSSPSLIAATLAASRSASPTRGTIPQLDLTDGRVVWSRRQSMGAASATASSVGLGMGRPGTEDPDTASIPPTTSLVSLFESKRVEDDVDPVKKRVPSIRQRNPDTDEQAMERAQKEQLKAKPKPKPKPKPRLSTDAARPEPSDGTHKSPQMSQAGHMGRGGHIDGRDPEAKPPQSRIRSQNSGHKPAREAKSLADNRPPTPPPSVPARNSSSHVSPQPKKMGKTSRPEPPTPPVRASVIKMAEPTVQITPVEPDDQVDGFHHQDRAPKPRQPSESSTSSNDTFVSASSVQSRPISPVKEADRTPRRPAQPTRSLSSRSIISTPDLQRPLAPHASTPNLTLSSLTNAIVASNLASARLTPTTPSQPPPIPAPRRPGRSPLQPHHTAESIRSQLTGGGSKSPNRHTPQPQKQGMLLQTLRNPHSTSLSDDESARRQHHRRRNKVLGGGNRKHAHHEGSRRRWRDEITPRERRRYEAVWASNRGLFLRTGWGVPYQQHQHDISPGRGQSQHEERQTQLVETSRALAGPEADLVLNLVARDIWSRSRLPPDELAEVWDLVDRQERGMLGKDEFVVGMWLVDQRLRGRKIPARVSRSVWESAGGGHGVVVPLPPSAAAAAAGGGGGKGRGKR